MPSEYKIGQYLEWCTDIPLKNESRESPTLFLKGNEWFSRLIIGVKNGRSSLLIYLELKNKHVDTDLGRAKCQIGFKYEDNLSLSKKEFKVSPHIEVWYADLSNLPALLPVDYMKGNWMKMILSFDDLIEPLLKENKKIGHISPDLQLEDQNFCLKSLSQDFGKMLCDGLDHDVEFKCGDGSWKVHKNVLSVRSKVLQAMLNSDMIEGRTRVITLRDMDTSTAQCFLDYLYSGKLPELSVETERFYEIGDKYAVDCLKKSCANYLVRNLTPEIACEILIIAHEHSDSGFKESVMNFITIERICMNDDLWCDFCQTHPMIACEVYRRFCKTECSS